MIVRYYELKYGRKTPEYFRYARNPYTEFDTGPLRLGYVADRIWEWDTERENMLREIGRNGYKPDTPPMTREDRIAATNPRKRDFEKL